MPDLKYETAEKALLANQFVAGVPTVVRQKVLEISENVTLETAISAAKRLLALQGQQPVTVAPIARTPYQKLATDLVRLTTALTQQMANMSQKLASLSVDATCTQRQQSKKPFGGYCWNCAQQGHVSAIEL